MLKRAIDIVISIIILAACTPLLVVVAILIKLDSKGPVFFRQVRIGRGGRPFRIYKLRTMAVVGVREGVYTTSEDDPRITRVGRVLRKYNLDELAQFINVIRGEMSIVGPRPEVPQYVAMFTEEEKEILTVRPGITDLATIWDYDEGKRIAASGIDDPDRAYMELIRPEKLRLQLKYVRNRSLKLDVQIMLTTIKTHLLDRLLRKRFPLEESRQEEKEEKRGG